MFRVFVVLALLSYAYALPWAKHHSLRNHTARIVGGQETPITKRPYQVSMIINDGTTDGNYLCGGSIISKRWILTAAHCLGTAKTITVRTGSADLFSGGTTYTTTTFKTHPSYNKNTHDYDIAAVQTSKDIVLNSSTVKLVSLAAAGETVPAGKNVIVSGWGTTSEGGQTSQKLREVTIPVVDRTKCGTNYKPVNQPITTRMLCAGFDQGGKDSCQGDSGGPLVLESGKQVGVVSFGEGCARANYPGVYADVAALRQWIKTTTGV